MVDGPAVTSGSAARALEPTGSPLDANSSTTLRRRSCWRGVSTPRSLRRRRAEPLTSARPSVILDRDDRGGHARRPNSERPGRSRRRTRSRALVPSRTRRRTGPPPAGVPSPRSQGAPDAPHHRRSHPSTARRRSCEECAMRAADALIAALERGGVDTVFGMPGGATLPLYDALLDSGIRHVLMRHEAGAGPAPQGHARSTGRVGVAFATSGPGATNLVTPIADAHMDSVPTVFVTGQVKTALRGTNAFQEADVIGITAPIVKHSIAVERPDDAAQAIVDALHVAASGRPGPVLVDLPVDVALAPSRGEIRAPYLPGYRPRLRPNGRQVRLAARAIAASQRPVLYAGGGVVHAGAA